MRCGRVFSASRKAASALAICCCRSLLLGGRLRSDLLFVGFHAPASRGRSPFAALAPAGRRCRRLLFALSRRPQVACALPAVPQGGQAGFDLLRRGRAVEDAQENLADQLGVVLLGSRRVSQVRSAGSEMAASTVGPLIRAMTGPSCKPLVRSHSQTLSRAGRPRFARKPSGRLTPESGRAAARVPGRHARNPRDGTGDAVDRVVEHFGRQPPGHGVRIVDVVVLVPAIGLDGKLIGPRAADQPQHVPHVEMMVDELAGQVIEQLRVGGRVAGADVVQRLDDARRPAGSPKAG